MAPMIGRGWLLLILATVTLVGCSSEHDRQWYKPGASYTVDEFKRDRDACTTKNELDEQCLKERGWVPLTSDRPADTGPKPPKTPSGRY